MPSTPQVQSSAISSRASLLRLAYRFRRLSPMVSRLLLSHTRLLLPATLCSTRVTRFHHSYGGSDSSFSGYSRIESYPCFLTTSFLPFCRQPPDGIPAFMLFTRRRSSASPSLVSSPCHPTESRSLSLWTSSSLPVALHPCSRRRSFFQLPGLSTPGPGLSPG